MQFHMCACLPKHPIAPLGCSLFHMVVAFHREVASTSWLAQSHLSLVPSTTTRRNTGCATFSTAISHRPDGSATVSKRPDGVLAFLHGGCLSQGGGVYIWGGTVSFESCAISNNEAEYVCNLLERHSPLTRWGAPFSHFGIAAHREAVSTFLTAMCSSCRPRSTRILPLG